MLYCVVFCYVLLCVDMVYYVMVCCVAFRCVCCVLL